MSIDQQRVVLHRLMLAMRGFNSGRICGDTFDKIVARLKQIASVT